ncbi:MAG: cell division protein ZapE [Pseudomonadota bacterium]|nr:cell division protein ZapE [Pseudomonadota bacterium]
MRLLARYEQALRDEARAADPAQRAVAERLDALDHCLDASPPPARWRLALGMLRGRQTWPQACRGIYLWGGVGRGKTWLMDLFAALRPQDCRRLHFQHLMREVHALRRGVAGHERPLDHVAAQLARSARVWCVDEFMVHDIGDAMILHGVLDGLLKRGVVLVLTSNTPPQRLYEGGLQRERFLPAIALINRMLDVVQMVGGDDFRLRQLDAAQTWFRSDDPGAPARMQALFERLAGRPAVEQGGSLLVEERPIATRAHAGGMAWFNFDVLCEGPRSADDYIALARQLHTLFLSGVPLFDGANDDAARRFIALIDELYDQRVRLVVAAATEPAALYRGTRLKGPFERTASRLMEMRRATDRPVQESVG